MLNVDYVKSDLHFYQIGKAIKKRTPSTSQVTHTETVSVSVVSQQPQPIDEDSVDYDQPLDLRLRTKSQ